MDDQLIGAESTGAMDDVATQLSSRFQLKILGVFVTSLTSNSSTCATIDVSISVKDRVYQDWSRNSIKLMQKRSHTKC